VVDRLSCGGGMNPTDRFASAGCGGGAVIARYRFVGLYDKFTVPIVP
jgi:hypothetical protein